jgi:hypothetical protein
MHRNALRETQIPPMQKHKFGVTCSDVLFVESVPVLLEHEKQCVDVLRPRRTRMHYVTNRSHRRQKQKFGEMCLGTLFVESEPVPPEHEM